MPVSMIFLLCAAFHHSLQQPATFINSEAEPDLDQQVWFNITTCYGVMCRYLAAVYLMLLPKHVALDKWPAGFSHV